MAAIKASGVHSVRLGWCDLHGQLRGKTLSATPPCARSTTAWAWSAR
ncbi:MAG: hypothetical protein R3E42_01215 [Burkholderiaceae bacterium]